MIVGKELIRRALFRWPTGERRRKGPSALAHTDARRGTLLQNWWNRPPRYPLSDETELFLYGIVQHCRMPTLVSRAAWKSTAGPDGMETL